jgi:hypothetical protein
MRPGILIRNPGRFSYRLIFQTLEPRKKLCYEKTIVARLPASHHGIFAI